MSIVSSYGLKDKKCISVNIYSTDAAVILRDFLIRVASRKQVKLPFLVKNGTFGSGSQQKILSSAGRRCKR